VPKIDWAALPPKVKEHLLDRARVREMDAKNLTELLAGINTNPETPDGTWCKDFGSFMLVGEGPLPKTFLTKEQPCYGRRI